MWDRPGTYFLLKYHPVPARSARLFFQGFPCKFLLFKFHHGTERRTSPMPSKRFKLTDEILHASCTGYQFSPDTTLYPDLLPERLQLIHPAFQDLSLPQCSGSDTLPDPSFGTRAYDLTQHHPNSLLIPLSNLF